MLSSAREGLAIANRFSGPIKRGEIRDADELKRRFRVLAKACHPDLHGGKAGGESFLRLRRDYEEALESLLPVSSASHRSGRTRARSHAAAKAPTRKTSTAETSSSRERNKASGAFDRGGFYAAFVDLVAARFPADSLVKAMSKDYRVLRERTIEAFAALGEDYGALFLGFEAELQKLREGGSLGTMASWVGLFIDSVCTFHCNPSAFSRNAVLNWRRQIEPELARRGLDFTRRMTEWLADDLDLGAALVR